ncbi:lichenan operon transcriptional antiterminator [Enterococcus sp. PF1-24]|uniref:BglG family transcription antiterminator n=1 Tax=unclassified Enterococcus TaxID=2608891 RepID=UPI002476AA5E|nr:MULTISPECIES: PTS sugar transporter subunit IIA [unclassified Enterococcus]MDH6365422.1 lichenan operon transcriptional antiterminator [Enterococcus sp. PFB1-1]MDH6402506.1 lichenan operon transcriptional antiterminator [Enterococcus sp. PF1-24]
MKEKQEQLIHFLLHQDQAIPSRTLAKELNVSIRTIKNYIAELNQLSKEPVIFSSNLGYSINHKTAPQLLTTNETLNIPQNYKDRAFFIIKKILINNETLDVFDLAEELFVSYSTLKADISRMNKTFAKYQVKFVIKQDQIHILGEEKEKRRLISYIIFEEMPNHFVNQEILEENFDADDVVLLSGIIRNIMNESNYYLNDFSFINLMLHLLILIESVRNGKSLITRDWFSSWLREDKALLVTKLIKEIEKQFQLSLNDWEKEEIHMIFQANVNYIPSENRKDFEQVVGDNLLAAVEQVLVSVHQTFGINLNSETFTVPFSLHLSSLFSRAKQASFLKNPMLDSLKKDFPIVYDIAIFMSLQLSELLEIPITEDESAYIALHIGAELEGQKRNFSKIKTVILCPKYMNLDEKIYQQMLRLFGNDLNIIGVFSKFSETETKDFELLITTLPVPRNSKYTVVNVSPLFTEEQRFTLISEIATMRLNHKKQILIHNFDDYFNEACFSSDLLNTQRDNLIKEMCETLQIEGFVNTEFYQHVLEREHASSTAFESIAIPHSVYMDAKKTTISVGISNQGIYWGNRKVYIVLLAAINDLDRQRFTDIYEALISLFDYPEIYNELRTIKTFEDFRKFIHGKIQIN